MEALMPEVADLTDVELEQLRRAVLDEQEARVLRARAEAEQAAEKAAAATTLRAQVHRFLEEAGGADELIGIVQKAVAELGNRSKGKEKP